VRLFTPSATLNFIKPSMALDMGMEFRFFDCKAPLAGELSVLRFTLKAHRRVEKSADSEKNSTAVRRVRDCVPLGNGLCKFFSVNSFRLSRRFLKVQFASGYDCYDPERARDR
jgi:hypothetical protein